MKLSIDLTVEHLIALVAILFILYFMMTTSKKIKEQFEQITNSNSKPKDRACGQESINYAFLDYVFGGVKSTR